MYIGCKMIRVDAVSALNIRSYNSHYNALSDETIKKLKALGINISTVTSEEAAKKIIAEKTEEKDNTKETEQPQTDPRLEKIYQRLFTLSDKIDVPISKTEKIETILTKIRAKIDMFEENNNNANISVISSEYDSIKYTYETITQAKSSLLTGMDILGKTNKAVMGIGATV